MFADSKSIIIWLIKLFYFRRDNPIHSVHPTISTIGSIRFTTHLNRCSSLALVPIETNTETDEVRLSLDT